MIEDKFASRETLQAPVAYFDQLRDEAPVFFSPSLGAFVVTRADLVDHILKTPEVFSSFPQGASANVSAAFAPQYQAIYEEMGTYPPMPTLVITDGEVHRRYRQVAEKFLSQTAMGRLDDVIRDIARELVANFPATGKVDLYAEFCLKLPQRVMCELMGLPHEVAPILKRGADTSPRLTSGSLETEETRLELHRQRAELHLLLQEYIQRFRDHPQDNVLSHIVNTLPADGVPFTDQELISIGGALNVGGNETTVNGIGNMFFLALTLPGMLDRLRSNPKEITPFIEEALRLESPVMTLPRRVVADTALDGVDLPAGSRVFPLFAAANRDEREFACPHALDLARPRIRSHYAFSRGPHFCLGAPLARAEMKISMESILSMLENVRLDPDLQISHQGKLVVKGVENLPILFDTVTTRPSEELIT